MPKKSTNARSELSICGAGPGIYRRGPIFAPLQSDIKKKQQQNQDRVELVGLEIEFDRLKQTSMVVTYRIGESRLGFGDEDSEEEIEWEEPETGTIEFSESTNLLKEPGINLPHGGWGYAGFHAPTGTYWRYKEEGEINYGEHCMQILKIEYSFCKNNDCEEEHCHRCYPQLDCIDHQKCIENSS
jgi:hypothetical protein